MTADHPYPDHAFLDLTEAGEKRWYSTNGMGLRYIHEDRAAEDIEAAIAAEREACAKIADGELMEVHDAGEERVAKSIAMEIRKRGT